MYESPLTLRKCVIDYISDNIRDLCDVQTVASPAAVSSPASTTTTAAVATSQDQVKLVFKNKELYIPSPLSDELLLTLNRKGQLDDFALTLFNSDNTRLGRVCIQGPSSKVTVKGLRVLRHHKITWLEASHLDITVNDLIGCLGEWTLGHLRHLNVAHTTFVMNSKFYVVVSLSKLRNLRSLNVSYTELNKNGLEIIAEDLPLLERLDISGTEVTDISALKKCRHNLVALVMYNLKLFSHQDTVAALLELHRLRYLDLSEDVTGHPMNNKSQRCRQLVVGELMQHGATILRHISSLDLSGKEGITLEFLQMFLDHHPHLRFVGLAMTDACHFQLLHNYPQIQFSGDGTERQLLECLRRYWDRASYVQKTLYNLFNYTKGIESARTDIMKLIIHVMRSHPMQISVQMAATACLYNLSRGDVAAKVHPHWLAHMVNVTLSAMENFHHHQQLQKNALLTLCSDRILQDVTFDKYRCARLVMECLCSFEDQSMNRMAVAICSILAAKIPTDMTSKLGSKPKYMKKLLDIIKSRTQLEEVDVTLKFTLSALWNLTDESASTCKVFLNEGGLSMFLAVLRMFEGEACLETKVLGLLSNIAEVRELRHKLLDEHDFIPAIVQLLQQHNIDISYFAAGIIAHLASDGEAAWTDTNYSRQKALASVYDAVMRWENPDSEMVAYRSFSPFFPLLRYTERFEVQLWAVWAIHHVCTKNARRYCPMLVEESGDQLLISIETDSQSQADVRNFAVKILTLVRNPPYPGPET